MSPRDTWVPSKWTFEKTQRVFCLSARHSGDMYHIRAAQLLSPTSSLILYEYQDKRPINDLVEYLSAMAVQTFVVPWSHEQLFGPNRPTSTEQCKYGLKLNPYDGRDYQIPEPASNSNSNANSLSFQRLGLEIRTEGASTSIISNEMRRNSKLTADVFNKRLVMVSDNANSDDGTSVKMEAVMKQVVGQKATLTDMAASKNNALVMWRESGSEIDGAYPEYNTGVEGLKTISQILSSSGCPPWVSGNREGDLRLTGIKGINEYWLDFRSATGMPSRKAAWTVPKPPDQVETPWVSTRDAEAYYLRYLFRNKYISMGVGLRSGAMDLLTFMGIPTVSIGLTDMVGEDRHDLLATPEFKRVNVRYSQPRHTTTARVPDYDPSKKWLLTSPFWTANPPPAPIKPREAPPDIKKPAELRSEQTKQFELKARGEWITVNGPFAQFDVDILKTGLATGCARAKGTPEPNQSKGCIVDAKFLRENPPNLDGPPDSEASKKILLDYITTNAAKEAADWNDRALRAAALQEFDNDQYESVPKFVSGKPNPLLQNQPAVFLRDEAQSKWNDARVKADPSSQSLPPTQMGIPL